MLSTEVTDSAPTDAGVWTGEGGTAAKYRVRSEIYRDETVFDQEIERIFESTWIYLCHDSEIPEAGDYRTVQVGRQPVIVTRGRDGVVRGLLTACRHRGSVVCRAQFGNANLFRCPYHGWTCDNTGALTGIPQRPQSYEAQFGRQEDLGLIPIARCESCGGLIFGAVNEPGNTLVEHLDQARKYVDLWADRSLGGETKAVFPPHIYSYPGNWKMQMENGADGYHGHYTHDSYFELSDLLAENNIGDTHSFRESSCARGFDNGHGLLERSGPRAGNLVDAASHGPAFERYSSALATKHGEQHADLMLTQRNLLLFPDVYLFERSIGVIVPRSVDKTDVYVYFARLEGVDEEVNERRLSEHQRFFGTAGFGTPDDIDVFVDVLLDEQRFLEWNSMFDEDGIYWVPIEPRTEQYDPKQALSLIYDDSARRRERVLRLVRTNPHCQNPPSQTIHQVGNIQVDGDVVKCTLFVAELRDGDQGQFNLGEQRVFAATCAYRVVERGSELKFREKRVNRLSRSTPIHNPSFIL